MIDNLALFFSNDGFMPHGMCYLWRPGVLWLHVVSDALISLSYASIPFTLVYFVRKRRDLEFSWMFVCFAVFIVACGATHVLEIWVIWHPAYWLSGIAKAITALASVPTAILLVKLIPDALRVPSVSSLKTANDKLDRVIAERERAQREVQRMNLELESRVTQRTLELEAANRSLRTNQELLHSVMQNSSAVIYIKDAAGRYLLINRRFQELFHVTQEWMIGKTDYEIFSKTVADAFRTVDEQVLASSAPVQVEELAPQDDGTHTYISIKCRLLDADGRPYAICGVSTDMTAYKRAEDQFRLALEAAPTGMLLVDQDGLIVLVNQQIEKLFDYTRDELVGEAADRLVPYRFRKEQSPSNSSLFLASTVRATDKIRDLAGCRRDGREFPIEIGLSPVQTSSGSCVIVAVTDLTSRKNAEELFRVAVEASPTGMTVVDADGKIVLINTVALRLFDYARDELLHQSIELLVPNRHQRSHIATRTNYTQDASARPMGIGRDLAGRRKDGSEFPLEIGLSPVATADGPCVIAAVTDLTTRKAADALREDMMRAQARLAAIVESSVDAIIGQDMNGIVTSWNAGAEALFGYRADEMIGNSIVAIIPSNLRDEETEAVNELTVQEHHFKHRDSVRRAKNGKLIDVSITISPIKDSQGRIIGVSKVKRDISDRIRSVAELRARSAELARSNAELEQFAYSASHDLQEPLRAIAGCVQLLRKRYAGKLDERADEYIDNAVDGAKRMQELIDDLLTYARVGMQKAEAKIVDCNEVLRRARANLSTAIEEAGAVIEPENLPELHGDRTQLLQLFQNLIGNAIKFRRELPPVIRIRCERRDNELVFAVSDNGIGIEARHFERIFGVFQRLHTRTNYPGTGIGLALCAKIVAVHHGRIWVESQLGVGTTFYFALPNAPENGES